VTKQPHLEAEFVAADDAESTAHGAGSRMVGLIA
jgi:hypothetical protein